MLISSCLLGPFVYCLLFLRFLGGFGLYPLIFFISWFILLVGIQPNSLPSWWLPKEKKKEIGFENFELFGWHNYYSMRYNSTFILLVCRIIFCSIFKKFIINGVNVYIVRHYPNWVLVVDDILSVLKLIMASMAPFGIEIEA